MKRYSFQTLGQLIRVRWHGCINFKPWAGKVWLNHLEFKLLVLRLIQLTEGFKSHVIDTLAFLENRCSGSRGLGRPNTLSISGYLKRLQNVVGNLARLHKTVVYHFHKRL